VPAFAGMLQVSGGSGGTGIRKGLDESQKWTPFIFFSKGIGFGFNGTKKLKWIPLTILFF
jgi:hypothetical protein